MASFFKELKRRNVFKVGAAYLVVGWVIIEVASTVAPQLNLPEWAPRLITLLVMLGFPIALLLAWIFDMTPDGVQVTAGDIGNKRFYTLVGAIAVAAVTWFALTRDAPPTVTTDGSPSIAVLPFVNMSEDPANEYFADGISEELLNILAGIEGLAVASRTSAFSFKGSALSLPAIARVLNVGHILEGSVRKQGNRVRITAQLIRADSDVHLWSETYDRDLTDIFRVQEEIAQAIATQLEHVLGTRRVRVDAPTRDLEAYQAFLRGRTGFHQRGAALPGAIADLQAAVRRDPGFAEAWAYLSAAANVAPSYRMLDWAARATIADAAVERALALNPDLPLALAVQGFSQFERGDAVEGLGLLRRAAELPSPDSTPLMWYGLVLLHFGYIDQAVGALERAYQHDPLVGINNGYLGIGYVMTGRPELARPRLRQAEALGWLDVHVWTAMSLAAQGDGTAAVATVRGYLDSQARSDAERAMNEALYAAMVDRVRLPEFRAAIGRMQALDDEILYLNYFLLAGDADGFFADSARLQTQPYKLATLEAWLPSMEWLLNDPRFMELAQARGIRTVWDALGLPPGCRIEREGAAERMYCERRTQP